MSMAVGMHPDRLRVSSYVAPPDGRWKRCGEPGRVVAHPASGHRRTQTEPVWCARVSPVPSARQSRVQSWKTANWTSVFGCTSSSTTCNQARWKPS